MNGGDDRRARTTPAGDDAPPAPSEPLVDGVRRVATAIRESAEVEEMMENALEVVLSVFDCDRAWLLHPCDPDARSYRVPMVCARPGQPGPSVRGIDVPMGPSEAETDRILLAASGPVTFGADGDHPLPARLRERFSVRSQMILALRPKIGRPWAIGIHQCSRERTWSEEERAVFAECGRRIGDALESLLVIRDLRESEERLRMLTDGLPGVVYGKICRRVADGPDWERAYMSASIKELLGERSGSEVLEDVNRFRELVHPDDRAAFRERTSHFEPGVRLPDWEYRVRTDSGEYIWVRSIARIRELDENSVLWHGILLDVTEDKRREERLRFTQFSIDHAGPTFWLRADGQLLYVNDAAIGLTGYSKAELLDRSVHDLCPELDPQDWPEHWSELRERRTMRLDLRGLTKDGRVFPVAVFAHAFEYKGEEYGITFVRDVSARRRAAKDKSKLEAQLRQAQKMEAVGQLAGGIAHDFNNILTAILGHGDLALNALRSGAIRRDILQRRVEEILRSARRAAELTNQLLVVGRRDVAETELFDLAQALRDMESMLRRLIGEEIAFEVNISGEGHAVRANRGQLEQVIMNLVINGQDAMPSGGRLRIEIGSVVLDDAHVTSHPDAARGPHIVLTVSDTGSGMSREVAERIYEPFFTTKPIGRGSGLGLSVVYGIIQNAGGHIVLATEPGRGTTFAIYLPAADNLPERKPAGAIESLVPTGTETVLLCEDDVTIRELTNGMLTEAGYQVLVAEDAEKALQIVEELDPQLDLLVTDLVMPGMNGRRLAMTLLERSPTLKTLFVSGYASDVLIERKLLDEDGDFLQKPFTMSSFLRRIRKTLDEEPPAALPNAAGKG